MKINRICLIIATLLTIQTSFVYQINATGSNQAIQSETKGTVEEDALFIPYQSESGLALEMEHLQVFSQEMDQDQLMSELKKKPELFAKLYQLNYRVYDEEGQLHGKYFARVFVEPSQKLICFHLDKEAYMKADKADVAIVSFTYDRPQVISKLVADLYGPEWRLFFNLGEGDVAVIQKGHILLETPYIKRLFETKEAVEQALGQFNQAYFRSALRYNIVDVTNQLDYFNTIALDLYMRVNGNFAASLLLTDYHDVKTSYPNLMKLTEDYDRGGKRIFEQESNQLVVETIFTQTTGSIYQALQEMIDEVAKETELNISLSLYVESGEVFSKTQKIVEIHSQIE